MAIITKKVYKSGKVSWYADFRVRGKRYRKKLDAQNKAQAKLLAQKLELEVVNKQYGMLDESKAIPLKKLSDEYIKFAKMNKRSWDRDVLSLSHILNMEVDGKKLGEYDIEDISPKHILTYQEKRKQELDTKFDKQGKHDRERNYASINREIACLKHIFYLAIDWEYTEKNPVARKSIRLFKEIRRDRILSEEEIKKLLKITSGHTFQIVSFALNTGMRLGEILKLTWEQIDKTNRIVHVTFTKNNLDRDVPINNFLSGIIETINENNEHLFHNPDTGKHLTTIKKSFASALRRAEISNFRFHDLRHTFSSHLSMGGIEENTRAELLGHSKGTITSNYTHANWERKIKAVEIIGKMCGQYLDDDREKL